MMDSVKKKFTAFSAMLLVVLLIISMIPQVLYTTVDAATINCYAIQLVADKNGNKQNVGVNGALAEIAEKGTDSKKAVRSNNNGQIIIEGFIEQGKSYTVKITEAQGYKDSVADFSVANDYQANGNDDTKIELIPYSTVSVKGRVIDENGNNLNNIKVDYNSENPKQSGSVTTNNNGEYSFSGYVGCSYSITANVDSGKYENNSVSVENLPNSGEYWCSNIQLSLKSYTVKLGTVSNGNVSNGNVSFANGETGTYTYGSTATIIIKADENYTINSITDNGNEIVDTIYKNQSSYNYVINNITEKHNIQVEFAIKTYKISFTVNKNGEVKYSDKNNPNGTVAAGNIEIDTLAENDVKIEVKANQHTDNNPTELDYHIKYFIIDKVIKVENVTNEKKEAEHTFNSIDADHTVFVEFERDTYEVKASINGNNGNIEPENTTVYCGDDAEFTITPNDGYNIGSLTINGKSYNEYTDSNGEQLHSLDINDDNKSYTLTVNKIRAGVEVKVEFEKCGSVNFNDCITMSDTKAKENFDEVTKTKTYVFENDGKAVILTAKNYSRMIIEKEKANTTAKANKQDSGVSVPFSETTKIIKITLYSENEKKWYDVNFGETEDIKEIIINIDKEAPEIKNVNKKPSAEFTNSESVIISGEVTDEGGANVRNLIYSTTTLSNDVVAEAAQTACYNSKTGEFSFEVTGEQNKTYYIYAVDYSNNVSMADIFVGIDSTMPEIEKIEFSSSETIEDLKYGIFSSESITVTVTAKDDNSGIKDIVLSSDEINDIKPKEINNNEYKFELSGTYKNLKVYCTDKAENKSETKLIKDIYARAGEIDVSVDHSEEKGKNTKYTDNNDKEIWYANDNINFTINVEDKIAGLNNIQVFINDEEKNNFEKVNDFNTTTSEQLKTTAKLNINTKDCLKAGENTIKITVTNNVGEKKDFYSTVYIDEKSPEINRFEIYVEGDSISGKIVNFLTFGIFCNRQVNVKVFAQDVGKASGVNEIALKFGEEEYTSKELEFENENLQECSAVFNIPVNEVNNDKDIYLLGKLSASATDNTGKRSDEKTPYDTELKNNLMIENIAPTIDVKVDEPKWTSDNKDWYSGDVGFDITASDDKSGIRSIETTINDSVVVSETKEDGSDKIVKKTYTVDTSSATIKADGSYELEITVTDNAGNKSTDTKTIYKDINAPTIKSFSFEPIGYSEGSTSPVEQTNYGFYFANDTKVTVTAYDEDPSSGINTIEYYLVDKDTGSTNIVSKKVDKNNSITFTVKANFKGQIYAKSTDNVDNTVENTNDGYVTPDGVVVESKKHHDSDEQHITFAKPSTSYKDSNGGELYSENVPVTVTVSDVYSGIRNIQWSVISGEDTGSNQSGAVSLNNSMEFENGENGWKITKKENNLATTMQKVINVSNNSNDIVVSVTMTDRAGNTTTKNIKFSIDKTTPKLNVTYNNNSADSKYSNYYSANRTATVVVTERNFRPENFVLKATNNGNNINLIDLSKAENWVFAKASDGSDNNTYTAQIPFTADGDYIYDISFKDNANNTANKIATQKFTIDKIKPSVNVTYDNTSSQNGNYYKSARVATVTVTEHNFDADRVTFDVKASNDGKTVTAPQSSGWTTNGDEHITRISYTADAKYSFDVAINDKSGNAISDYPQEEFFVDTTAPTIEISGVADKSANNSTVAPVISYSDTNFNVGGVDIKLSGANKSAVDYPNSFEDIINGQKCSYADFEHIQEVDDIYTLSVNITDYAGNPTKKEIMFSVNRFGSVYTFDETLSEISGKYINTERDIVFTETNVDSLSKNDIKVKMTQNGNPTDLVLNKDYTIVQTGGKNKWSQYLYKISKKLFESDGSYSVQVYSKDAAGNVNENIDETKKAEISFGVDKTEPVVVPVDFESEAQYPVENKIVSTEIKDNLKLDKVKVYLNDNEIAVETKDDNYTFSVPQSSAKQTIRFVAIDAAGNKNETEVKDFLVSTNLFVRWYNNTVLFIITIVGFAVLCIGVAALIIFGKKRKKEDEL